MAARVWLWGFALLDIPGYHPNHAKVLALIKRVFASSKEGSIASSYSLHGEEEK